MLVIAQPVDDDTIVHLRYEEDDCFPKKQLVFEGKDSEDRVTDSEEQEEDQPDSSPVFD